MGPLRNALALGSLLACVAVGCSKPEAHDNGPPPVDTPAVPVAATASPPAEPATPEEAAQIQATMVFRTRCSTCHGADGKGNGPAALTLNPKPRNYTDAAWQKSVTDDHIREIIVKGGAALGKSPNMLANPDLQDKPLVLDALVRKVRSAPATASGY